MDKCPKCGGEVHGGEVFVNVTTAMSQSQSSYGLVQLPGMGLSGGEVTRGERLVWREKTGRRTGFIIKSDEEKLMRVEGRRCTLCGYIELFAKEKEG